LRTYLTKKRKGKNENKNEFFHSDNLFG